jgi:hypothetical protein
LSNQEDDPADTLRGNHRSGSEQTRDEKFDRVFRRREATTGANHVPSDNGESGSDTPRLEEILARFEEACESGRRPVLDDHLPAKEPLRRPVLIELVHADLEYRVKAGEAVRVENYLDRYPELAGDLDAVLDLIVREGELRFRHEGEAALGILPNSVPG